MSTVIRPYGDTLNDGRVQLSFTLPVPFGEEAKEAGRQLALKMGLENPAICHAEAMGPDFTLIVLYGQSTHSIDMAEIEVVKPEFETLDKYQIDALIADSIGRKLVVVGACTGTDAHTVGLDAILNAKGFHGVPGLERYRAFQVHNLGSQVENGVLVQALRDLHADVVLVSQVVTQKDVHISS